MISAKVRKTRETEEGDRAGERITNQMEEAKQQQQQQQLLLHEHQQQQQKQQQQQQQQQFLLLQQLQQQKQQQQQAISRFPSNIDAHLRPPRRPINLQQTQMQQQHNQNQMASLNQNQNQNPILPNQNQNLNNSSSNSQQTRANNRTPTATTTATAAPTANQAELQMAYQDAWRVCHPDFKRPFTSLEDACERLLPYHVVADYEAEEDDRILDSDTTGQVLSRSQQWDHSIAAKVAEFTATFEKQVLAFNIISRKRDLGEFRSEERLMIEQALLQEERRALLEARAEMESRQKAGREAHAASLRMAAMAQAEQAQAESQAHAEMIARAPIRASALGSHGNTLGDQEQEVMPDEMMNGWANNTPRDDKEPCEDFLNDEERENGDASVQNDWLGGGEFDLNTR